MTGSNFVHPYSASGNFIVVEVADTLPFQAVQREGVFSENQVDSQNFEINISAFVDIKCIDEFSLRVTEGLAL